MDDKVTDIKNKTILLADDEQFIILAYKKGLELAGYDVIIARDGAETLDLLQTSKPDLLLLDLIMPRQSGFEVLQKMKADPKLKNIPVFVLTNLSQESDEKEVRNIGVEDFFIKADVSLSDIIKAIDNIL